MERIVLSQDSEVFSLLEEDGNIWLDVSQSDSQEEIVRFPLQKSLLKSVLSGFSYQIANEHGSLQISTQKDMVVIAVHTPNMRKLQAKIENKVFSRDLDAFVQ